MPTLPFRLSLFWGWAFFRRKNILKVMCVKMGVWKKICAGAMSALLAVLSSGIPVWQEGIFAMRQVVASAHTLSTNSAYTGDYVYQDYLYYSIFDGEAVIMDCSEACTEVTIPQWFVSEIMRFRIAAV